MSTSEKYISEALLRDKPKKPLGLFLRDGSVTTSKIKDKAVTEEKIADNSITTSMIKEGSITWALLDSMVRAIIKSKFSIIPIDQIKIIFDSVYPGIIDIKGISNAAKEIPEDDSEQRKLIAEVEKAKPVPNVSPSIEDIFNTVFTD